MGQPSISRNGPLPEVRDRPGPESRPRYGERTPSAHCGHRIGRRSYEAAILAYHVIISRSELAMMSAWPPGCPVTRLTRQVVVFGTFCDKSVACRRVNTGILSPESSSSTQEAEIHYLSIRGPQAAGKPVCGCRRPGYSIKVRRANSGRGSGASLSAESRKCPAQRISELFIPPARNL